MTRLHEIASVEGSNVPEHLFLANGVHVIESYQASDGIKMTTCTDSIYGQPVSAAQAAQLCPAGEGGLIYHAHLVSDTWTHPKDCTAEGKIKPRRATIHFSTTTKNNNQK